MLEKTQIKMNLPAVEGVLRRNGITAEKSRLANDKGFQLRLTNPAFKGVNINVYDSGTVLVQGKSGKAQDAVYTLLLACMVVRELKKKGEDEADF